MTATFPVVETNPWLAASLLFIFMLIAPGLAWSWLCPCLDDGPAGWRRRIASLSLVVVTGLLATTLVAFVLAETGRLTLNSLSVALAALAMAGLLTGRRRLSAVRKHFTATLPGTLLLVFGFALIMLIPQRGEWIVGGWDPGIYINQGVHVAQTGSFHNAPLPWHSFMSADDWNLFTRGGTYYREMAPGIPVTPASGTIEPYFFRLMPSLVAVLDLCGGLRAATRVSDFMALLSLIVFTGMLTSWKRTAPAVLISVTLLALHPLWLYHAHLPTTEMFHLVLICGAGLLLSHRQGKASWLLGLLIFATILNRFDFAAFSALLIAAIAILDFPRTDRRTVLRERALQLGGLATGYIADTFLCNITLQRLDIAIPTLIATMLGCIGVALATDLLAGNARIRTALLRAQRLWDLVPVIAIVLGVAAILLLKKFSNADASTPSPILLLPYIGIATLIAAGAGLGLLLLPRATAREERIFMLFLLALAAALFIEGMIVPTYPWSTRRFVPSLVPALAALGGAGIAALAITRHRIVNLAIAAALVLIIAWTQRTAIRQAIRSTEYDGASRALAEVAAHIRPTDVLIADHHWWSTPLTHIYNRPALDGNLLLHYAPTNAVPRALAAVGRWHTTGQQILFLTSTRDGLGIYKHPIPNTTVEWTSQPVTLREVIHSKTSRGYETKNRTFTFQLHRWQPAEKPEASER